METCFVIMPIGDQFYGNIKVTAEELKHKYDDLIKESILKARPELEIVRADEISLPGPITTDIFTRIMHSKYVVADISYPNPNVFYELGLRHAISNKTILIKEKGIENKVFDISYLRYIEYENNATGLKNLQQNLIKYFEFIDRNPEKADNHFLELAILTKFKYPIFVDNDEIERKKKENMNTIMSFMLSEPELFKTLANPKTTKEERDLAVRNVFSNKPDAMAKLLPIFLEGGFNIFESKK